MLYLGNISEAHDFIMYAFVAVKVQGNSSQNVGNSVKFNTSDAFEMK